MAKTEHIRSLSLVTTRKYVIMTDEERKEYNRKYYQRTKGNDVRKLYNLARNRKRKLRYRNDQEYRDSLRKKSHDRYHRNDSVEEEK